MTLEEAYNAIRQHAAMYANAAVMNKPYMPAVGDFFRAPEGISKLALDYDPEQLQGIIYQAEKYALGTEQTIMDDIKRTVRHAFVDAIKDAYVGDTNIFAGIIVTEIRNS